MIDVRRFALPQLSKAFVALADEEPRLWSLTSQALEIRAQHIGEEDSYCANSDWVRRLKPRLCEMVGWSRKGHPTLGTEAAYDLAYQTIYVLLPDCRNCECL